MDSQGFWCVRCGEFHKDVPMSYGANAPIYYFNVPLEEREKRCNLDTDLCVIDDEHYYINGCIEIPVKGQEEPFVWGVWVSLSKSNYDLTVATWDAQNRHEVLQPMFGWLSSAIHVYPETINLKTNVHTREVGLKPLIELEPTDHPLAIEQREGITKDRVLEVAERLGALAHQPHSSRD